MSDVVLESTKIEVDGFTYTVTALDTVAARKVWFKVLNSIVPALKALNGVKADPEGVILQAVATLVENLSESTYAELCDVFGKCTTVELPDGRSPLLKDVARFHFSRRLSAETRWLFECCKWNFEDFLGGTALGDLRALIPLKLSKSTVPKT